MKAFGFFNYLENKLTQVRNGLSTDENLK